MHISLTPELEALVKKKVESGYYNNASEVIREALRFMEENRDITYQLRLQQLRQEVAKGAEQAERGEFSPRKIPDLLESLNHGPGEK